MNLRELRDKINQRKFFYDKFKNLYKISKKIKFFYDKNILTRNYKEDLNIKNLKNLRNFCKTRGFKIFLANNLRQHSKTRTRSLKVFLYSSNLS